MKCKLYSTLLFKKEKKKPRRKKSKKKLINQYYNKEIKLDLMDNMVDDENGNENYWKERKLK